MRNRRRRNRNAATPLIRKQLSRCNEAVATLQRCSSGVPVSGNRRVAGRYLRAELWLLTICHWPEAFLRSTDVATPLRFTGAGTALSFGPFFRPMV